MTSRSASLYRANPNGNNCHAGPWRSGEFTVYMGNSFVRLLISNLRRTQESSDGPPGKTPASSVLHRTADSSGKIQRYWVVGQFGAFGIQGRELDARSHGHLYDWTF